MLDKPASLIGQSITRIEDPRFLTGRGAYTDDRTPGSTLHAIVLRAPEAHARITRLDVSVAAAMPGVHAVLTAGDAAADGLGHLTPAASLPLADGTPMRVPPRPVLAENVVRFVGDPVALVVAETVAQAKDAAEAIELDLDALPAVTSVRAIHEGSAAPFDPDWPDHHAFHFSAGDKAATDAAFANAAHVTRLTLEITRVQPAPMEPRVALGEYDAQTGHYTLTAPCQSPWRLRDALAQQLLHIEPETLRVISPDMGGGFGNRSAPTAEQVLVLWASRRLGQPVKWLSERSEGFLADDQARESMTDAELALDAEGRFIGLRSRTLYGVGAYHSSGSVGPATANIGVLAGVYAIPAMHAVVDGVMLHVNPSAAYRGAGRPEYCYILERLVDTAARETGADPVSLRRRNMIAPAALPYKTALGNTYDSGDFATVMARALEMADWAGFEARRKESEAQGRLRGRGMACSIERAGLPAIGEKARLKLREDGSVSVAVGTHSHGQGHETAFRQVAGDALGLGFDALAFEQGDTDLLDGGGGTMGSRSAAIGGGVIRLAAQKLVEAGRQVASEVLEAAVADIEFDGGEFRVAGSDITLDWARLAREAAARDMLALLDIADDYKIAAPAWPNGCAAAEVEIDPETGHTALVRYAVMGDYGTVLNPLLLDGQLHGGIAQGAGQILQEALRWDAESGQPLSASFMDYAMPRAGDLPMMTTGNHPVPTEANVMSVKGVGEAGCVSAMPAVMNAVVDALAPLGVRNIDMPASPERVWAAIEAARG
jgi:carbon-monoxide dehydrogenase large subunit